MTATTLDITMRMVQLGGALFTLRPGMKQPLRDGYQIAAPMTPAEAAAHADGGGNLGLHLGRSNMICFDAEDKAATAALVEAGFKLTVAPAKHNFEGVLKPGLDDPSSGKENLKVGGSHVWLRVPDTIDASQLSSDHSMQLTLPNGGLIDVLAGPKYVVAPPSALELTYGARYQAFAGGPLDLTLGDEAPDIPDAPMWLFDLSVPCPSGLAPLHGCLIPRVHEQVEQSARSAELSAQIDEVPWDQWLAGEHRLTPTGEIDGCGCDIYYWQGSSNNKSATLHDGCEQGNGVHVWSGTMIGHLGLSQHHLSRLDLAVALRREGRSAVAASVGIQLGGEREEFRALRPADYEWLAEQAEKHGDTTRAATYREAAVIMAGSMPTPEARGETFISEPMVGTETRENGAAPDEEGCVMAEEVEPEGPPLKLTRITGNMPPPDAPLPVARELVRILWTDSGGRLTLRKWRGDWIGYTGRRWALIPAAGLRQAVYVALEQATVTPDHDAPESVELEGWNPTSRRLDAVLDALSAAVLVADEVEPQDGSGWVAMTNGILDTATRQLHAHTPDFFSFSCLPYAYRASAGEPVALLGFLRSLWPNDQESINLIQEWLGYCVSGQTGRQKGLLLLGPPRSGKGTLLWLIKMLVGVANSSAPTLASMCANFGLQTLIGKSVALVGDARLGSSTPTTTLVERLLSIIGEDELQVDRKYRDPWTGRLGVRITIASNELPRFVDASAAVVSRLLIVEMRTSFLGREDHGLKDRLAAELPAILSWALDGLDRLEANGRFTRPAAAAETEQELEDLASPTKAFLREECVLGAGKVAVKADAYRRWDAWCMRHGHQAGSQAWFARNLKACGITAGKESTGERRPLFLGFELKVGRPYTVLPDFAPVVPIRSVS